MITTLPRELRDIIYEYILCDTLCKDVAASTNEPASPQAGLDHWHVEKVGDTASKELLEVRYRPARFYMGEHLECIERFLSSNVARLGIPRCHLITKISITFKQRDVVSCKNPLGEQFSDISTSRPRLLERLEHLFLLKRGASIHLYVIIGRMAYCHARILELSMRHERKVLRKVTTAMSNVLSRLSAEGYCLATGIIHFPAGRPDKYPLYDLCSRDPLLDEEDYFANKHGSCLILRYAF
jgi:hypothetical protein